MAPPRPLLDPLIELVARRFRVIGEPMRIRLLDHLRRGDHSVGELAGTLGASQQNVSKHLGVLHEAGMVERRKAGTRVVYGIADPTVFALCEIVCDGLARHLAEMTVLLDEPGGVVETLAAGR